MSHFARFEPSVFQRFSVLQPATCNRNSHGKKAIITKVIEVCATYVQTVVSFSLSAAFSTAATKHIPTIPAFKLPFVIFRTFKGSILNVRNVNHSFVCIDKCTCSMFIPVNLA